MKQKRLLTKTFVVMATLCAIPVSIQAKQNQDSIDVYLHAKENSEETPGDTKTDSDSMVPFYMQPGTVLVYDENLDYNFECGGEAIDNNVVNSDVHAYPGMKVIYDKKGEIRNVYYPSAGKPGTYQLSPPSASYAKDNKKAFLNSPGLGKVPYPSDNPTCVLNFGTEKVTGTGQITYYGKVDNPPDTIGDHDNKLIVGDCATKMAGDDIPDGISVTATNTKNNHSMKFTKNDKGTLPNAILDIYEDGTWSKKGICGLTVNGVHDSVDKGKISHPYK